MDNAIKAGDFASYLASAIRQSLTNVKTDLTASLKAEEAEADPGAAKESRFGKSKLLPAQPGAAKAEATAKTPGKWVGGGIRVEAASFEKTGGENSWGGQVPHVLVHDCFSGGKQVYFQQQMKSQWADYSIEVPGAEIYQISMQAACVNEGQSLEVCSGGSVLASVPIALGYGLWQDSQPVEVKLERGKQMLRVQTTTKEHMRGIALHSFTLKPVSN